MANQPKNYIIPFFRHKKFGDKYLISTDNGAWTFLTKEELIELNSGRLSNKLYKKLENDLIIITELNKDEWNKKNYDSHWYRGNGTSLHIFIPTLRCNFTCKYCYAYRQTEDAKGYDMTPEIADAAVDFAFQSPAPFIVFEFSGGEPLLRFDIVKRIIERAETLKKKTGKMLDFALVTNGSLLDKEKFEFLKKHRVGICFSLDGPKELHDLHRKFTLHPQKSTYEEVVKKIKWLKEEEKYPFVFAIPVITRYSFKYWKEIIDEYVKLGIKVYRFKYISFFGFASNYKVWQELGYKPEEFIEYWKKTINYLLELNKKGIKEAENITLNILRKLIGKRDPGYAEMQTPCGATIGQIVYNYDGYIYPCDEARTLPHFKIGHVLKDRYWDVLQHPITRTMIAASSLVESCYNCPYYPWCGVCPLENYKMHGTFIVNVPNSYRCKIHKSMFDFIFDKLANDPEFYNIVKSWIFVNQG